MEHEAESKVTEETTEKQVSEPKVEVVHSEPKPKRKIAPLKFIREVYEKKYKLLLIIPMLMLLLALLQIGFQTATTGDFLNKGVGLKGGISVTLTNNDVDLSKIDTIYLQDTLTQKYPSIDFAVREITE